MLPEQFRQDCKYWLGRRPCDYQRANLVKNCQDCTRYFPFNANVLIIEAGGLGSVLKTTIISSEIKRLNPHSQVQWLTHEQGSELLQNVPSVDVAHVIGSNSAIVLQNQIWDRVVNFETTPFCLGLTRSLQAVRKYGFEMNDLGKLRMCSNDSVELLKIQTDDSYRATVNQKPFQQILMEACGYTWRGQTYDLMTNYEDDKVARNLFHSTGAKQYEDGFKVIGLNIGSSLRMDAKRWGFKNFFSLASKLGQYFSDWKVAILAGPEDKDTYQELQMLNARETLPNVVFTGYNNSISQFLSNLKQTALVISVDTFGLHAAIGLGRKTVSLYGPYPGKEIHLPHGGEKIELGLECSPCFIFKADKCRNTQNMKCMEDISVQNVFDVIQSQLNN